VRVGVREPGTAEERRRSRRRDFAGALDRARRAGDAADRGRARTSALDRRDALDRGQRLLRERRAGFDERERDSPGPRASGGAEVGATTAVRGEQTEPPAPSDPAAGFAPDVRTPELRALLRALPVAVDAAAGRGGDRLELAFGRSLSVEVRVARGGVEIALRPDAGLSRAAASELPALVCALRARGVSVVRAEVRPARASPR
jgi:hypothetical protein